jgi:hypothetical protein
VRRPFVVFPLALFPKTQVYPWKSYRNAATEGQEVVGERKVLSGLNTPSLRGFPATSRFFGAFPSRPPLALCNFPLLLISFLAILFLIWRVLAGMAWQWLAVCTASTAAAALATFLGRP